MGATTLSRRRFNEELLATLPIPPSELESLRGSAGRKERDSPAFSSPAGS